ncbi:hypothetical protein H2O64_20080 [Kordia sp. YSTF-M3]|uniref:Addiction module component n=1 Tax=Kordia aestuariivivens TaxID=2759037 RepID=A0ABR7QF32_9FLAO|nr:hypothetical protein [Kordia aestuariivivens]MBC8756981.1 hypothetical protein [Kordia aestuariivivens]
MIDKITIFEYKAISMDLQLEKYKLMEWLVNLKDEAIIHKLKEIKNDRSTTDWSDTVSETEKLMIEAGLKDVEEGNTFTHQQVMEEINKNFPVIPA